MGHSAREMDPEGFANEERKLDRLFGLRKKLENLSLDQFKAGDLGPLIRLFGDIDGLDHEPMEKDFKQLEHRLKEIKRDLSRSGSAHE